MQYTTKILVQFIIITEITSPNLEIICTPMNVIVRGPTNEKSQKIENFFYEKNKNKAKNKNF